MNDKMRSLLDQTIEEIRNQEIAAELIDQSAARVWARLLQAGEAGKTQDASGRAVPAEGDAIRGCADFQVLIPAYLARNLSEARTLLLEDHTRECVACRRALHAARYGAERMVAPGATLPKRGWNRTMLFGGAVAAVIVAFIVISGVEGMLPSLVTARGRHATVQSVSGALYAISGQTTRRLVQGGTVGVGEEIRTASNSTAAIRLVNGSWVEMSGRADVAVTRGWFGTTIHLAQGAIIVQAARHDSGHLSVETRDCLVSDRGTIFAVTEGVKGARVSVIQGEVRVKEDGHSEIVHAGGQLSTGASLTTIPIRDQISWSPDAAHYLALLGELAGIGRELKAMPGSAPRFSSQLVGYVPENTVIYAAIPNLESTLKEVNQLFQGRLAKSVLLDQWWKKQQASGSARAAQEILQRVEACSSYLGDEIVFAAAESGPSRKLRPLVLAKVERPGFRAFLEEQLSEINPPMGHARFRIVDDAATLPSLAPKPQQVLILLKGDVMAVASGPQELREIAALIGSGRSSGLGGFARTDFYSAIQQSYHSGAGWLLAVNLEQISATSVHKEQMAAISGGTGLANVKYLFAESKDVSKKPEDRVTITFAGERRGLASWLAAPSPMGTLDYVSPQASFALSFVLKDPKTLIGELFGPAGQRNPKVRQALQVFESETGVSIENDLAASLGGEVTVAQDGPFLPAPQWIAVMDVYHPGRLETSLAKLVNAFNEKLGGIAGTLRLTQAKADGRVFYTLRFERPNGSPSRSAASLSGLSAVHYTFANGYLLVASSRSQIERAIENQETGYSLTRSQEFQAHLPEDGSVYFSALFYENLGEKLSPLLQELRNAAPAASDSSLEDLAKNATPVMIGVYGEPSRIMVVSNESPLGLGVNSILGAASAMLRARDVAP